jgi:hypothetical protein
MPITSEVDKTRNLTIYTLIGSTTIDEIHGALKSFWEAHELTLNLLWDARSATVENLRISDIESIVRFIRQYRNRFNECKSGKSAIIASTELQYGLSRALEILFEMENFPHKLKPFRTIEEANQWLSQSPDLLDLKMDTV